VNAFTGKLDKLYQDLNDTCAQFNSAKEEAKLKQQDGTPRSVPGETEFIPAEDEISAKEDTQRFSDSSKKSIEPAEQIAQANHLLQENSHLWIVL